VYITPYNIPPHHYMPQPLRKQKKLQKKAAYAQSIRLFHQSRLISPTASAGPDANSSAASTPLISSTGSDVEPRDIGAGDQSDVDGTNSKASSPDAMVISDTLDAENVDDWYGSDV
jgi:hypothetical protein